MAAFVANRNKKETVNLSVARLGEQQLLCAVCVCVRRAHRSCESVGARVVSRVMSAGPSASACSQYSPAALATLLQDDTKLAHLVPLLREQSLGGLLLRCYDRINLLAHLKLLGIAKLQDRQQLANALSRHMRTAVAPALAATPSPADLSQPVLLSAPLLLERYGRHAGAVGLLAMPDGSFAHVNELPAERYGFVHYSAGLQQPKLDGPILGEVARLASLTGRPVYVPMMDEDAFVFEPAFSYLRGPPPQVDAQKLQDVRDALGPDVAVLTSTFAHGLPSVPGMVGLIPCFDSWAAEDAYGDEWLRRLKAAPLRADLPYSRRKDQAVWRGAKTGGDTSTSLRGRVVEICRGQPWADVAFVADMHGRGMAQAAASGLVELGVAVAGELTREQQAEYKILLCVDGHTWASSWEWALASGCVIIGLGVWAFHATAELEPWAHFVPCHGAEQLPERVAWVLEHPREAEQMTHKAFELFKRLAGTPDHAKRCIARTLTELAL